MQGGVSESLMLHKRRKYGILFYFLYKEPVMTYLKQDDFALNYRNNLSKGGSVKTYLGKITVSDLPLLDWKNKLNRCSS